MTTRIPIPISGSFPPSTPGFEFAVWDCLQSAAGGLTALAGGGKAGATPLTATLNHVATVATAADSVLLPPGEIGMWLFVRNSAAAAMQVFGAGSDTINGVATGTGVSQAATTGAIYFCTAKTSAGVASWFRILGTSG
jgi:hypothetical protein